MIFGDVSNKSILVTGATSGIGKDIGQFLRKSNANLFLTGRSKNKISQLKEDFGNHAKIFQADLVNDIDYLVDKLEVLDGLVLCAGTIQYDSAKSLRSQRIKELFEVNFFANIDLISSLIRSRKLNRNASVVIISSVSSKMGVPGTLAYAASKAALEAAARVYAGELARRGIRFNTISPGLIKTPLLENDTLDSELLKREELKYPLGIGTPGSISSLVRYLLSDESTWLTGENIVLDGGLSLKSK